MERIEGAKLIGSTWHYNKRVPKRVDDAFDLSALCSQYKNGFIRGSMKTKDSDEAKRKARKMLAGLDELEAKLDSLSERVKFFSGLSAQEQNRLEKEIEKNVAALPPDQRQLIRDSGGALAALRDMKAHETSALFMMGAEGADYAVKDDFGEEYDPDEREINEVQDAAFRELQEKKGRALRNALASAKVVETTADNGIGLRDLLDKFCEAKGYVHTDDIKNKTRGQYE